MSASPNDFDPHVVATITPGRENANPIPDCPEGWKLHRVWALLSEERFREVGLVHRVSAFLEDEGHDYKIRNGKLHYFSHQARPGQECRVVFEFAPDPKLSSRPRRSVGGA